MSTKKGGSSSGGSKGKGGGVKPPAPPPQKKAAENKVADKGENKIKAGAVKSRILNRATEKLPCKLGDEAIKRKHEELSRTVNLRTEHKAHMKKESSRLKAELDNLDSKVTSLALATEQGIEDREVGVEDHAFYEEGVVKTIRVDTQTVVRERPLRSNEFQDPLPFKGVGPEGDKDSGGKVVAIKDGKVQVSSKKPGDGDADNLDRCPYVKDGQRCTLKEHSSGEHKLEDVKAASDKAAEKGDKADASDKKKADDEGDGIPF